MKTRPVQPRSRFAIAVDWALVATLFGLQAFVMTGGISRLIH